MKRRLYDRLCNAFGEHHVQLEVNRMFMRREDPLDMLTFRAQHELFDALLRQHKTIKRLNAQNRRIAGRRS